MKHLSDEELTDLYYGESTPAIQDHLRVCAECRSNVQRTEDTLRSILKYRVPEPEPGFERRVWAELAPRLPATNRARVKLFSRPWILAAVTAALLILVMTPVLTRRLQQGKGISPQARARVFLISLGDHLDRSQVLLAELANAQPGRDVMAEEREVARDLVDENRLLRQASNKSGDASHGALLDDLERILLAVANAPPDSSAADFAALQRRIDDEGLLFKVRITGNDLRHEEQNL